MADDTSTLLLCVRIRARADAEFGQWQVLWQTAAVAAGAASVEFWPPAPPDQLEAVAVTRFASMEALRKWRRGKKNRELVEAVAPLVEGGQC